jgi:16S rRNA processing protein RimM
MKTQHCQSENKYGGKEASFPLYLFHRSGKLKNIRTIKNVYFYLFFKGVFRMTEWFYVGKIVNTHGIRGEVRVISQTDFADERYAAGSVLYVGEDRNSDKKALTVQAHRRHKNFDLLQFEGLNNINFVEPLKGMSLYVNEEQLGELNENEFYYHEIIGCEVYNENNQLLGKITEILSTGANDVWVVKRKGKKDALIPYIENVVKSVDPENKRVDVELLPGLVDDED